jgi:hypothetical protein
MPFLQSLARNLSVIGRFWQDPHHSKIFQFNLVLISFQILYLVLRFSDLPPQTPLYYSLTWGETRLASASNLFLLPTFSILITLVNHFIAIFLVPKQSLFSYLLIVFSLIFSVFSSIGLFHIINLVT